MQFQTEKLSQLDSRILNFTTTAGLRPQVLEIPSKKIRVPRDPMSHRIIEKRRRDRMNNCLANLSQLIPSSYMKQGQGRIEKTEIIEMAITHIKHLQVLCRSASTQGAQENGVERFYLGYKECMDEVMRFMVEKKGYSPGDSLCVQLVSHLQDQSEKFKPKSDQDTIDCRNIKKDIMSNSHDEVTNGLDKHGSHGGELQPNMCQSQDSATHLMDSDANVESAQPMYPAEDCGVQDSHSMCNGMGAHSMCNGMGTQNMCNGTGAHSMCNGQCTNYVGMEQDTQSSNIVNNGEDAHSKQSRDMSAGDDTHREHSLDAAGDAKCPRNTDTEMDEGPSTTKDVSLLNTPRSSCGSNTVGNSSEQSDSDGSFFFSGMDMRAADAFYSSRTEICSLNSNTQESSSNSSFSQSKYRIYKFKDDIKLRFNADKCDPTGHSRGPRHTDSLSSSSQEEGSSPESSKKSRSINGSNTPDSLSTAYSSSDGDHSVRHSFPHSHKHSHSSHHSTGRSCSKSAMQGSDVTSENVPGFALHPMGTYYVPVIIHVSSLTTLMDHKAIDGLKGMCHPISIPVCFGGPFLSTKPPLASQHRPKAEMSYGKHHRESLHAHTYHKFRK